MVGGYGEGSIRQYGPDEQVEAAVMDVIGSVVMQEDGQEDEQFAHPH